MGEGEVGWFDYQPSTYDDQDNNEEDINIWDTPRDKDIVLEPSIDDKKVSVVVLCTFNSIVQFITSSNPGSSSSSSSSPSSLYYSFDHHLILIYNIYYNYLFMIMLFKL